MLAAQFEAWSRTEQRTKSGIIPGLFSIKGSEACCLNFQTAGTLVSTPQVQYLHLEGSARYTCSSTRTTANELPAESVCQIATGPNGAG